MTTTPTPTPTPAPTTRLTDIVVPQQDYLLVRRHPHSRQIGVGLGGRALIAPETAADLQPCRSGVVLKSGPLASYAPGSVVAFGSFAMTVLEAEGDPNPGSSADEAGAVGLVASSDVLCTFSSDLGDAIAPLALEGADFALAPPGSLLVERSVLPAARGRILLPGSYTGSVQSMEARVVHTWSLAPTPPRIGDYVLLSPQAGRPIPFGRNRDRVLYSIYPSQILCLLAEAPTAPVEAPDELGNPLHYRGAAPEYGADALGDVWDEGDPRAPR